MFSMKTMKKITRILLSLLMKNMIFHESFMLWKKVGYHQLVYVLIWIWIILYIKLQWQRHDVFTLSSLAFLNKTRNNKITSVLKNIFFLESNNSFAFYRSKIWKVKVLMRFYAWFKAIQKSRFSVKVNLNNILWLSIKMKLDIDTKFSYRCYTFYKCFVLKCSKISRLLLYNFLFLFSI